MRHVGSRLVRHRQGNGAINRLKHGDDGRVRHVCPRKSLGDTEIAAGKGGVKGMTARTESECVPIAQGVCAKIDEPPCDGDLLTCNDAVEVGIGLKSTGYGRIEHAKSVTASIRVSQL